MARPFHIKLQYGAIRTLTKVDGTVVDVEIEGVRCRKDDEPLYDVREIVTRIGYPAAERDLKPRIKPQ